MRYKKESFIIPLLAFLVSYTPVSKVTLGSSLSQEIPTQLKYSYRKTLCSITCLAYLVTFTDPPR